MERNQIKGTNENYSNGIRHDQFFYQLELCTSKIIRCRLTEAYSVKSISQAFREPETGGVMLDYQTLLLSISKE